MMNIPKHIAIIMDGNGRWARRRGLPRNYGHKKGIERIRDILEEAKNIGVQALTLFAFSTENWNRPREEIDALFSYMENYIDKERETLLRNDIKLNVFGRKDRISKRLLGKLKQLEKDTNCCKSLTLNLALDYGGRWDILQATHKIAEDILNNKVRLENIDENVFSQYLCLSSLPEPDLLIRTSGELRISNFLLWQLAYTELYFPKVYWPDFNKNEFRKAIKIFNKRSRRFGGVNG